MFESAVLPHLIDKARFKSEEPALRERLLAAQNALRDKRDFSVILVFAGVDGAGKGALLQRLWQWFDPRFLQARAYGEETDEERARPRMWRFWRDLPPKGDLALVLGSWYGEPMRARVLGKAKSGTYERELANMARFEEMLELEGALILKFWFHLSIEDQKKRLKAAQAGASGGRFVLEGWSGPKHRRALAEAGETALCVTGTAFAPWIVVPSADARYRDLVVGKTIAEAMEKRLAAPAPAGPAAVPAPTRSLDDKSLLESLDLTRKLDPDAYEKALGALQERLATMTDRKAFRDTGLVLAFEGSDAAGKGGSIRRVAAAIDPRRLHIHPIAAPSDEEKARPYLWRFWRRIPPHGQTAIFDRTWYGRVLVERVEGFATEGEWLRAYNEINAFETELVEDGYVVLKFWLAISPEEQLRRFKARETTAFKQYKITKEDWRNRQKWGAYRDAVDDMVDRTSLASAPWTLVEAEDKLFARIKVLETICDRLERAL